MSAQNPKTITEWLVNLPIPWLVGNPNGKAEWTSWGSVLDGQVDLLRQGIKARFPTYAPSDALPHLGGDRVLVQGPTETDANFRTRLKFAWDTWTRAGQWVGLLEQLYWGGFTNAVIVQQNGLGYSLSGAPTAGVDPTPLLTITTLNATTSVITSSVTPTRTIPAGTPWFYFDGDTDHCSRFAVLFPGPLPSAFVTSGTATFLGTEDGSTANPWPLVTWNNAFIDTTYKIQPGVATVTDGGGPVSVAADNTTKTPTGVRIAASASFAGTVDVLAWQAGANPFADLHPADVARLKTLIETWRPNALCVGVYALTGGEMWDYPIGLTWDGDSLPWDQNNAASVQVIGVF